MAISSMTGFGAGSSLVAGERIAVELRSVNGKFCEVKARLPRELASLEGEVGKLVKERIARGNVDVSIRRTSEQGLEAVPQVNAPLLAAYAEALRNAARVAGIGGELFLRDLVGIEGIVRLEERLPDVEASAKALREALATALEALVVGRQREGAALEADLRGRLATLRRLVTQISEAAPASLTAYRERLHARVKELAGEIAIDPARLEVEVIVFAERTDIAEELTRLSAHLEEFERLVAKPGPVGRQLDFLIQEINREVNTTGSKSQSTDVARLVVELKTEIERIREQVQNVE